MLLFRRKNHLFFTLVGGHCVTLYHYVLDLRRVATFVGFELFIESVTTTTVELLWGLLWRDDAVTLGLGLGPDIFDDLRETVSLIPKRHLDLFSDWYCEL